MNNYNVIVASDHKGNKSLTIVKGKLTPEMTKKNNIGSIDDPKFEPVMKQLVKLFNQIDIKGGDSSCN